MQLILSIKCPRGITRLPHWLVGTDKICCSGDEDQQAKGDKCMIVEVIFILYDVRDSMHCWIYTSCL